MTNQTPEQAAKSLVRSIEGPLKEMLAAIPLFEQEFVEFIQAQREQAVREASQWQPIETAPKDGQLVIVSLWHEDQHCEYVEDSYWLFKEECWAGFSAQPTHWMPLPTAPEVV